MQTGGSLLHTYGISKSVGFGCNFSVKNQTGYAVQHSCNYQKVARSGYETTEAALRGSSLLKPGLVTRLASDNPKEFHEEPV